MLMSLLYRQLKWRLGFKSPIVANIKITNRCNLRCKMCTPEIRSESKQEISTNQWKEVILKLKKKGIKIVVFEGGEPTLREDLPEIIEFCKKRGVYTITITNGLNDFNYIKSDVIWISVDGKKEHHERVRGENIYDGIKSNIKKARDKNIMILSMINSFNKDSIKEFLDEYKNIPVYFNWLYGYKGVNVQSISRKEKIESANIIRELKKKGYKVFNSFKTLDKIGKPKNCNHWLLTTVDVSGKENPGKCMVENFNKVCDCSRCDLGCYIELNNIYNLDYNTRKNWEELVGIDLTFK